MKYGVVTRVQTDTAGYTGSLINANEPTPSTLRLSVCRRTERRYIQGLQSRNDAASSEGLTAMVKQLQGPQKLLRYIGKGGNWTRDTPGERTTL